MIVYGDAQQLVGTRDALRKLEGADQTLDGVTETFIRLSQIETGVTDALCPERDGICPVTQAFREAMFSLAGRYLRAWSKEPEPTFPDRSNEWSQVYALQLPDQIALRPLEGFDFYSLFPAQYAEAANLVPRSGHYVVVGIRSIGTALSSIVCAKLRANGLAAASFTVRPRGHPFNRTLILDDSLLAYIDIHRSSHFLVADEGPGLSGSSFASVADALTGMGIPKGQITLLPSWETDGSHLRSDRARHVWREVRSITVPFETSILPALSSEPLEDYSGGLWRAALFRNEADYPAVNPMHERRKYRRGRSVLKFEGLGETGRRALDRARILYDAGFSPEPLELRHGFLASRYVEGTPLDGRQVTDHFLNWAASYLSFVEQRFQSAATCDLSRLAHLIEVNLTEGLSAECAEHSLALWSRANAAEHSVEIDGRMLPHEWLATSTGYTKVDALDHHADHFFPGMQSILWDVAGLLVEFQLQPEQQAFFLKRFSELSRKDRPLESIELWKLPYLAYRLGYARLSKESAGGGDSNRFARLEAFYVQSLRTFLQRSHDLGPSRCRPDSGCAASEGNSD